MMLKNHQTLFHCNIINISISLMPFALLSLPSFADDPTNTIDVVSAGITAKAELITRDKPVYPRLAQQEYREGWVLIDFAIDQNGRVQNSVVLDSVGGHVFELAAVKSVGRWQYRPAQSDGKAVLQGRNTTYVTFAMNTRTRGSTKRFADRYNDVLDLITDDQIERASALALSAFDQWPMNLYELSKLWSLRAQLALVQNDTFSAKSALQRATANNGEWLDQQSYKSLMLAKVHIDIETGQFESAIESFNKLLELKPRSSEQLTQTTAVIESLKEVIAGNQTLATDGFIHPRNGCVACEDRWSFQPVRQRFTIEDINGELLAVNMICDRARVSTAFASGIEWLVPPQFGICRVDVLGNPESSFRVHQLPN